MTKLKVKTNPKNDVLAKKFAQHMKGDMPHSEKMANAHKMVTNMKGGN